MGYEVAVLPQPARRTAVITAATTWQEFPGLWKGMLDEVWAVVTAAGLGRGCRNVMLYRADVPHVEVGVELLEPCPLGGRVVAAWWPPCCRTGRPRSPFTAARTKAWRLPMGR